MILPASYPVSCKNVHFTKNNNVLRLKILSKASLVLCGQMTNSGSNSPPYGCLKVWLLSVQWQKPSFECKLHTAPTCSAHHFIPAPRRMLSPTKQVENSCSGKRRVYSLIGAERVSRKVWEMICFSLTSCCLIFLHPASLPTQKMEQPHSGHGSGVGS